MRKIFTMATLLAIALGSHNKLMAQDANSKTKEARQELNEAKKDSAAEYKAFKEECESRIKYNEKKIADLKQKKKNSTKEEQLAYDEKVKALKEKNLAIKKKLHDYKQGNVDQWTAFRLDLNRSLDEVAQSLKEIGQTDK